MCKNGFVSDFSTATLIRGLNKVLNFTSLNSLSVYINVCMERWLTLLIDSVTN